MEDNMLLNNQWINDQIKIKIQQYMETNDNTKLQLLWDAAKAVKRKVYSNPGIFKVGRTIPNEWSNVTIIEIG